MKIINYHALGAIIQPEVEKITGKSTTINTLVVAIKRYSDSLADKSDTHRHQPVEVLRDATITMTSDVAGVTIRPKKSVLPIVMRKIAEVSSKLDYSPDLFKSSGLIKLVAGEKDYKSIIRSELGKTNITEELTGLSKLTLHLSPQAKRDSEFGLFISELLYRKGINMVHFYIDEDTVILLKKSDAGRAFEILDKEITRSKTSFPKLKIPRKKPRG